MPSLLTSFTSSLKLLPGYTRWNIAVLVGIQTLLSILDLLGILSLGVVVWLISARSMGESAQFPPLLATIISDSALDNQSLLVFLAIAATVVLALKPLLGYQANRYLFYHLAHQQAKVSVTLLSSLSRRPKTVIDSPSSNALAYTLTEGVVGLVLGVVAGGIILITEVILLIILTVGLLLADPLIAGASLVMFGGGAIVVHRLTARKAQKLGAMNRELQVRAMSVVQEFQFSYRENLVSGRLPFIVEAFSVDRNEAARVRARFQLLPLVPRLWLETVFVLGGVGLFAWLLTQSSLAQTLGLLTIFLLAATRVMPAIIRLQNGVITMRGSQGQAQSVFQIKNEVDRLDPQISTVTASEVRGQAEAIQSSHEQVRPPHISVSGVSFSYELADRPAVCDVSFSIPRGSSFALVGESGAGKSTLTDLILGVRSPNTGEIYWDALHPLDYIQTNPGSVSYSPQDIFISNSSMRSNIALGLPTDLVSDSKIMTALKRSHLDLEVLKPDSGLDAIVGERGQALSGGQRQRIALARALYSDPLALILDEPTSSLDGITEGLLQQTLRLLQGRATVIVVAHRLSTIREFDQIAYLDSGRITAIGTFDELRRESSRFRDMALAMGL